ncbi:hypothetical protein CEUSTIGMA_g3146.t1 [Chlamydomonas eustigma]|uniref:Uncharacterized protein n=1 Tax=Chlamydomonas eustigma TaxID=1157962 RepID=A0A250WXY6_9CHLO|nr:hypothetical protein CEUSTIGMA_g3146.t1 [Chlamydomonas eustigma]|eukprot:GAX75703.1 hypothetical protein CEUSTIGMA_g3146.t1 [Chlamydomonas eustigma]
MSIGKKLSSAIAHQKLRAEDIAEMMWEFAQHGQFPRGLFDAASRSLVGLPPLEESLLCLTCSEADDEDTPCGTTADDEAVHHVTLDCLQPEDLYRLAWAFTGAWLHDERHRAIRDVQLMDGITKALSLQIQDASSALLVHSLAILAEIPHYDPHLYDLTASVILSRGHLMKSLDELLSCRDDEVADTEHSQDIKSPLSCGSSGSVAVCLGDADVLLAVKAYSKVQHRNSPKFMSAAFHRVHQIAHELPSEQLLAMATAMNRTGFCHNALMKFIIVDADGTADPQLLGDSYSSMAPAVDVSHERQLSNRVVKYTPTQLLELSRAIASVQHNDPVYYDKALRAILKSVNLAQLQQDLDRELSDNCGSTTPDGIKK